MSTPNIERDLGVWTRLGSYLGRSTLFYMLGTIAVTLVGIVSVAVLTRYMPPVEYGRLTVLMIIASMIGMVGTLGVIQGANVVVWGGAGGGAADDDGVVDFDEEDGGLNPSDAPRAFTSALVLVVVFVSVIALVLLPNAAAIGEWLLNDRHAAGEVRLAIIAGCLGGIWRLVHNVPRLDRRPVAYGVLSAFRPVAVLAISIPLVVNGNGAAGATAGVAAGTALAIVAALVTAHRNLALSFSGIDARAVERAGRPFILITFAMYALHTADSTILALASGPKSVGLYKVASRIAVLQTYVGSAFLMGWGPFTRTAAFSAIRAQKGPDRVNGILLTYYVMGTMGFLLVLVGSADLLVHIAAPAYQEAADVLPLLAASLFVHGLFVATYRFASFPHKRTWVMAMAMVAACVLVGSALILIPLYGLHGAALASAVGSLTAAGAMYALQRRGPHPIDFDRWRVGATLAFGGLAYVLTRLAHLLPEPLRTLGEIAAIAVYPALLILFGVIPRHNVLPFARIARETLPNRRAQRRGAQALAALSPEDARLLHALMVEDVDVNELARQRDETPQETVTAAALATAAAADVVLEPEHALAVGEYLYATDVVAEANTSIRVMIAAGQRAQDLDELDAVVRDVAKAPAAAWETATGTRPAEPVAAPTDVPVAVAAPSLRRPRTGEHVVLLTAESPLPGGRVAQHAAALGRAGMTVTILVMTADDVGEHPGGAVGITNVVPDGRLSQLPPLRRFAMRPALRVRARRMSSCDLVIADGARSLAAARRFAQRTGAGLMLDAHEHDAERLKMADGQALDAVIVPSYTAADELRAQLKLPVRPVVLHDVPDLPAPHAGRVLPSRLASELGLLVLADAATLTRDDGEQLVDAMAHLPTARLVLLGVDHWDATEQVALQADVSAVSSRLTLLRGVGGSRLRSYVRDADVIACGSNGRGVPSMLYAALLEGRPVVADAGGETARALAANDLRAVVSWRDAPGLADALLSAGAAPDGDVRNVNLTRAGQDRLAVGATQRALATAPIVHPQADAPTPARSVLRQAPSLLVRPRSTVRLLRGRRALRAGDPKGAARQLTAPGSDPRTLLARAAALKAAGLDADARAAYHEVLDAVPPQSRSASVAAINLARLGDRATASAVLDGLRDAPDASPGALVRAAEIAAALRRPGDACTLASAALERDPEDPMIVRTAARVLDQAGEPTRALTLARRAGDQPRVRRLSGLIRTLDADWHPMLPWAPLVATRSTRRVLNLLETSRPHAHAGYVHRATTMMAAERQAGFDPVVATRLGFPASRGVTDHADVELVEGVVHHRLHVPRLRYYTSIPQDELLQYNADLLAPLVRRLRPAAILATTPHYNGLLALAACTAFELPMIYDVRGFPDMTWGALPGGQSTEAYRLRRASETRCMREADVVITLSDTMRGVIVERGIDPERVHVVPHAVDTEALRPQARDGRLARQYDLDGRIVIGYVGSILDYEGLDVLLEALAQVRQVRRDVVAVIAGDGDALPALRRCAEELGVADHVRFTGRLPPAEAHALYGLFDVACVPRRSHEVCQNVTALKPFEVMATGSCLLVSDVAALAEVADGGRLAATFAADDAADCARVVLELCADPDRRRDLGRLARAHVAEHHNHDVIARAIGGALDAALEHYAFAGDTPGPRPRLITSAP